MEQILTANGHHGHWLASGLSLPKAAAAQTPRELHAALGADLEGEAEERLPHQVSHGASRRGKAAAGSIRAQLHQRCAALAQVSEALTAVLESAEPS